MRSVVLRCRGLLPAPPEAAWRVLTDWQGQAAWMPDVAWIRPLGPERGPGASFRVRTRVLGVPAVTDVVRVVEWRPPTVLAIEHLGPVRGRGEWRLEPMAAGTRLTWREELSMPPPVLGEVALRCYAPVQLALLRRSIRNLARLVAAAGVGSSGSD